MDPSYDLVIVGGGTAGLVAAAGAASLGARVALVERDRLGGECLWTGCVPSKAMIASAGRAHALRGADAFGIEAREPDVDGERVLESVRRARSRIQPHDDPERFREMGVEVLEGVEGRLLPGPAVRAGDRTLDARYVVLATGSRPAIPPIEGLEGAGYVTHEAAFDRRELPGSSVILGGGAIGVEFAQAYARLGVEVTLVEQEQRILPGEDPDLTSRLRGRLEEEGVRVMTGARAARVDREGSERIVRLEPRAGGDVPSRSGTSPSAPSSDLFEEGASAGSPTEEAPDPAAGGATADGGGAGGSAGSGGPTTVRAEEVFVATGRRPNVEGLGLEEAGVEVDRSGIVVDENLRTTRRRVFAAGDVTGGALFTHVADHEARTVIRNALFPFSSSVDYSVIPRAVYTDPELARVGPTEAEAREHRGDDVRVFTYDLSNLDRAVTDRRAFGMVKLVADRKGELLAGHLLAPRAGTMIVELALARREGADLSDLADLVHPYPTLSEGVRRAANEWYRSRLTPRTRRLLRLWFRLARKLGL